MKDHLVNETWNYLSDEGLGLVDKLRSQIEKDGMFKAFTNTHPDHLAKDIAVSLILCAGLGKLVSDAAGKGMIPSKIIEQMAIQIHGSAVEMHRLSTNMEHKSEAIVRKWFKT